MIGCPRCGRKSSEYRWSMKTAARFSVGADTCPPLIQVLLAGLDGRGDDYDGYRLICPGCNNGVNADELAALLAEAEIRAYAAGQGAQYCDYWY
ncbi:MAG: hypothetical protein Q4B48_04995 [Syntrophomonadaceae bacterium]|nr:hypothetical protein [Syntrophomonadaceae bacterium]